MSRPGAVAVLNSRCQNGEKLRRLRCNFAAAFPFNETGRLKLPKEGIVDRWCSDTRCGSTRAMGVRLSPPAPSRPLRRGGTAARAEVTLEICFYFQANSGQDWSVHRVRDLARRFGG
jgi:hypothetical protein